MPEVVYDVEELIKWKEIAPHKLKTVNPVLRTLVYGVCDPNSSLSIYLGTPHIIQLIWRHLTRCWRRMIKKFNVDMEREGAIEAAFIKMKTPVTFPKPKEIYINMMPFVMETTFLKSRLPKYLKPYWDHVINKNYQYVGIRYPNPFWHPCSSDYSLEMRSVQLIPEDERGKIGFLTIHESFVEEGQCQRRSGLHTENPGKLKINRRKDGHFECLGRYSNEDDIESCRIVESKVGGGTCKKDITNKDYVNTHPWGLWGAQYGDELQGGIYMASSVTNSSGIRNCRVLPGANNDEIIGNLGDVEHLREVLPDEETLEANKMYWLSDRTPHESLPMKKGTYHQYFRLVTSDLSLWFEEFSTQNPLGVVPDPRITKVVKTSNFDNRLMLLLDLGPDATVPGAEDKQKRKESKRRHRQLKLF